MAGARIGGAEDMSKLIVSQEYSVLLEKVPPKVIRTEKANEAYTEILS